MMKILIHFLIYVVLSIALGIPETTAQLAIQSSAQFRMQSNAVVSMDGLVLTPSSSTTLSNVNITKSSVPISLPQPGQQSIARVYNFSNTIAFTGLIGILYQQNELNGLTENILTIATRNGSDAVFSKAANGIVNTSDNYVRATYASSVNLWQVTAMANDGTLPVQLASFEVFPEGSTALLRWTTAMESNSSHFEILHSLNAKKWSTVDKVPSKRESTTFQEYHFIHHDPVKDLNYYQLRMVDLSSESELGPVKSVLLTEIPETRIYPNPVSDVLTIQDANWNQVKEVILLNHQGTPVYRSNGNPKSTIDVSHFTPGSYSLRLVNANGSDAVYKVILGK